VAAAPPRPRARGPAHARGLLLALVVAEIAYFAHAGSNFFTTGNAGEVARASVEIGLLAWP
jgi:ribose/xylose/arabinose/galactoside ABC-type transport system permease subunit